MLSAKQRVPMVGDRLDESLEQLSGSG